MVALCTLLSVFAYVLVEDAIGSSGLRCCVPCLLSSVMILALGF